MVEPVIKSLTTAILGAERDSCIATSSRLTGVSLGSGGTGRGSVIVSRFFSSNFTKS
jgi:hypothetical protein